MKTIELKHESECTICESKLEEGKKVVGYKDDKWYFYCDECAKLKEKSNQFYEEIDVSKSSHRKIRKEVRKRIRELGKNDPQSRLIAEAEAFEENFKEDKEMDTQQEESKILPEKYPELLPHTADDFVSFLVGFAQLLEKCPSLKERKTLSSGKVKYKITDDETVWINSPKKAVKLYIKQNFSTPSFDFSRQKGHIPREIFLPNEKDKWDLWLQETGAQLGLEKEQSPNSDELPSPKDIPSSTESIEDYRDSLRELGFSDKDIGRLSMREAKRIVEESIRKEGHFIKEGELKEKEKVTTDREPKEKSEKEPFEMTREEARSYWEEIVSLPPEERPGGQHAPFAVFGQPSEEVATEAWEWFCQEVEKGEDIHQIDKHHYASILIALSENKSVPEEVLADYPGLKIDTSEEEKALSDSSEKELPKELQSLSEYMKKWGKWNEQEKWTVEAKGLEEARRLEAEVEKLERYEAEENFIKENCYSVYFFRVSKLENEEETDTWEYGECPVPQDPKSFLDVDPDDLPKCLWSVRLWLEGIDEDYQEEKEKFLGDAKGNLTYAVEWAEDKVKAEWKWVQVDIFRRKNFNTPEKVFQILKELHDTEKENLVKGYRMPNSTGHFTNVVALAQHEARVDLVGDLHWIEHGLKHFLEKHS